MGVVQLDYKKIQYLFEQNIGLLSLDPAIKPLDSFFKKIPISDRSMCEYFMRKDLKCNPIDDVTEIVDGMYWDSPIYNGITKEKKFIIPAKVTKYADTVFKGSDLSEVVIASVNDGVINLNAFIGTGSLKDVFIDKSLCGKVNCIDAGKLGSNIRFNLHVPLDMMKEIVDENSNFEINADDSFIEFLDDENRCIVY